MKLWTAVGLVPFFGSCWSPIVQSEPGFLDSQVIAVYATPCICPTPIPTPTNKRTARDLLRGIDELQQELQDLKHEAKP